MRLDDRLQAARIVLAKMGRLVHAAIVTTAGLRIGDRGIEVSVFATMTIRPSWTLLLLAGALVAAGCGDDDGGDDDVPPQPDADLTQADAEVAQPDADLTPDATTSAAPSVAGVTLAPLSPLTADALVATPGATADADGDPVTLSY